MTVLTPLPSTLGGIGFVLIGVFVAANGLRAGSGPLLRRAIPVANGGGWRAVLLGVLGGLAPPSRLSSTAVVGLASSRLLVTNGALSVGLGAGFATLVSTVVCALASVRPAFFYVCLLSLGCAALLRQALPMRAAKGIAQIAVGWAILGIGAHLFAQGVAGLSEPPAPTYEVVSFGMGLLAFGVGLLSAAFLGGGAVIALIVGAAAAGVLEPICATAAILGAHSAGPLGVLLAERASGNPKRMTAALWLTPALLSAFGFLVLSVFPGLLPSAEPDPQRTVFGIAAFVAAFWLIGSMLGVFFQATFAARLETWIEAEEGDSVDAMVLPEIAWTAAEARDARCTARTLALARKILTGGVQERDDDCHERAVVHQLADELESILESEAADPLAISADVRRPKARTAVLFRRLVDELSLAREEAKKQDPALDASVSSRLKHLSITLLGLIESSTSLSGGERLQELSIGLAKLEAECVELERWVVQVAGTQLDSDLALALVWRLGRLRDLGRIGLEIAASRGRAEPAGADDPRSKLARWMRPIRPRRQGSPSRIGPNGEAETEKAA